MIDETIVAHKPAGLSHIEAAAVPLAGGTAWQVLVDRLQIAPAETVLIHGGAGGVGSFAVQIAKAAGSVAVRDGICGEPGSPQGARNGPRHRL